MILYADGRYRLESRLFSFAYTASGESRRLRSWMCLLNGFWPSWFVLRVLRLELHAGFANQHGFGFFMLGKLHFYSTRRNRWLKFGGFQGKRPLKPGLDDSSMVFGEYFSNPGRVPVGIFRFGFRDLALERIHTLEGIRHVHGVKVRRDAKLIVLCGDYGDEARIVLLSPAGEYLDEIRGADQLVRGIDCHCEGDKVYYGTDTQLEQNYICVTTFASKRLHRLCEVDGPVFNVIGASPSRLVFTTACEVGLPNRRRITVCALDIETRELHEMYAYELPIPLTGALQQLLGIPTLDISKSGAQVLVNNRFYRNAFRTQFSLQLT